jgi:uncharacterized protein involved in exopolysaccharide biosynthesis
LIKAYWFKIVLFGLAGAIIALALSLSTSKKYEAIEEFMIDQKPVAAYSPQSTAEGATQDLLDFTRPRSLQTQVEQLESYGVVKAAATKVAEQNGGVERIENPNDDLFPPNLQKNISVTAEQGSDIISLRVRLPNKELAEQVAREMYLAFTEQNENNAKALASQAIASLEKQSADMNGQLKAVDEKSKVLRAKLGMPDVTSQITADVNGLASLRQARDAAEIDLASSTRQVAVLSTELARTPRTTSQGDSSGQNQIYQKLSADLVEARGERTTLLTKYLPDRDEVKAVDARIAGIENEMKHQQAMVKTQSNTGPNPNWLGLQAKLSEARANADSAASRLRTARTEVAAKERELQTLPPIQAQLADLSRQQQALERIYFGYADRLKTLQAAQTARMSPTREVTPAVAFPQPVSPKPTLNAIFGLIAGCILGVMYMLGAEAKRQPVRSLQQLNGLALKPVYRLIPELREPFRGLSKAPPEPYESLLAHFVRSSSRPYRIAVVGISKDSGASTTAINLALAGAHHGANVLMVECDPKGAVGRLTGREVPAKGKVVEAAPLIKATVLDSALSQTGGMSPDVLANEGGLTIIDLEPTTRSAEYAFLASHMDEVILLVRAGSARSVEFLQAQQALRDAGCPRVTVVLTRSSNLSVVMDAVEVEQDVHPSPIAHRSGLPAAGHSTAEAEQAEPTSTRTATAVAERPKEVAPVEDPEPVSVVEPVAEKPKRVAKGEAETVEDFGGIVRAKQPEKPSQPEAQPEAKPEAAATNGEQAPRGRRTKIDTSSITS